MFILYFTALINRNEGDQAHKYCRLTAPGNIFKKLRKAHPLLDAVDTRSSAVAEIEPRDASCH